MTRFLSVLGLSLVSLSLLAGCNRAEKEARAELAKLQATLPLQVNPLMTFTKAELVGQEIRLTIAMDAKLALKVEPEKLQKNMRDTTCSDAVMRKMNKTFGTAYLVQADGATFHTISVPKGVCDPS